MSQDLPQLLHPVLYRQNGYYKTDVQTDLIAELVERWEEKTDSFAEKWNELQTKYFPLLGPKSPGAKRDGPFFEVYKEVKDFPRFLERVSGPCQVAPYVPEIDVPQEVLDGLRGRINYHIEMHDLEEEMCKVFDQETFMETFKDKDYGTMYGLSLRLKRRALAWIGTKSYEI